MKKKVIMFYVVAMMLMAMVVGCGKDVSTETTPNESIAPAESTTPVDEPSIDESSSIPDTNGEVVEGGELGEAGDIPDANGDATDELPEGTHVIAFQRRFDNEKTIPGIEGPRTYTNVYNIVGEDDWVYNETYLIFGDENSVGEYWHGKTVSFAWETTPKMGEFIYPYTYGKSIDYYDADFLEVKNYWLEAWYGGDIDDEKFEYDLTIPQETWVSFSSIPYTNDDSFEITTTDNLIKVKFAVANEYRKGYAYFIVDKEHGGCYQFVYTEENNVYDEEHALRTINSIAIIDKPEMDVDNIK